MTPIIQTFATPSKGSVDQTPKPSGLVIRIPKPNWQVTALVLIAIVAAFQTFQLAWLKGNVTPKVSAATSTSSASTGSSSSSSGLESQVGGC